MMNRTKDGYFDLRPILKIERKESRREVLQEFREILMKRQENIEEAPVDTAVLETLRMGSLMGIQEAIEALDDFMKGEER